MVPNPLPQRPQLPYAFESYFTGSGCCSSGGPSHRRGRLAGDTGSGRRRSCLANKFPSVFVTFDTTSEAAAIALTSSPPLAIPSFDLDLIVAIARLAFEALAMLLRLFSRATKVENGTI